MVAMVSMATNVMATIFISNLGVSATYLTLTLDDICSVDLKKKHRDKPMCDPGFDQH